MIADCYFAQLFLEDKETADGYWNEFPNAGHAQTALGKLKKQGNCWVNKHVKICSQR